MIRVLSVLVLSLSLAACGSSKKHDAAEPTPAAEPAPAEPAPSAEGGASTIPAKFTCAPEENPVGCDMLNALAALADIMFANKDDCDAMAKALDAFVAANGAHMKATSAKIEALSDEEKQAFGQAHSADMQEIMPRLMEGAQNCQDNEAVKKALANMEG